MSFPYLSDVIYYLTGVRLPLPFATFGILVACAMLAAGACLRRELRRLHDGGRIGMAWRSVGGPAGQNRIEVAPQELVGTFTVVVLFAGVAGARLFHILEHLDTFMADPLSMIFNRAGLSVFGGLIAGAIAGSVVLRRWHLPLRPFLDAIAPAMMLGYAIGRLGCQIAGDGDWGTMANMALKPAWLPTWLWAQTYTGNIFGEAIAPPGVYPTPIYETGMALVCFGLLWAMRRHPFRTGWLFSVYLLLAGAERLLIEQIRVNVKFDLFGMHVTQAEFIAVGFMVAGIAGMALLGRRGSAACAAPRSAA
jgi:phosphatidylglycerol:prolipoprotein diacylglycerol transferase